MNTTPTNTVRSIIWSAVFLLCAFPASTQVLESASPKHLRAWSKYTDGMKDSILRIVNDSVWAYQHNDHFRTSLQITTSRISPSDSSLIWSNLKYHVQPPLSVKDFVFFNPLPVYQKICEKEKPESRKNTRTRKVHRSMHKMEPTQDRYSPPIPYSLRFYTDPNHIIIVPGQTRMYLDKDFSPVQEPYLRPFYFRKYQVSNAEYREFVGYVRDSVARTLLFEAGMTQYGRMVKTHDGTGEDASVLVLNNKEPIFWYDDAFGSILEIMYIPQVERYYRHRSLDPNRLLYRSPTFASPSGAISIYPDTSCWLRNFPNIFIEPFQRYYFWYEAYDHYPVVGISYWQAMAYLDWMTRKHQQELDRRGVRLRVVCDLPSEAEWDIAATAGSVDGKPAIFPVNYGEIADKSWITNLQLKEYKILYTDSTDRKVHYISSRDDELLSVFEGPSRSLQPRLVDLGECIFVCPVKMEHKSGWGNRNEHPVLHADPNGIFHMGSNASEWLKDSYAEQWQPLFNKRQELLSTFSNPDMVLLARIEQYFDRMNDPDGKLDRGANWYDRRYFSLYDKNIAGMHAKCFIDPNSTYPTLGFRYVMRFEPY